MIYEAREKAWKDEQARLVGARLEGKLEGKSEGKLEERSIIAFNLLDVLDDDTISVKTGLTIDEIVELRRKNEK